METAQMLQELPALRAVSKEKEEIALTSFY